METSIILPTYNERDNIVKLVENIKKLNLEQSFEILIVDDNSPDKTYQVCVDKFKPNSRINCLIQ